MPKQTQAYKQGYEAGKGIDRILSPIQQLDWAATSASQNHIPIAGLKDYQEGFINGYTERHLQGRKTISIVKGKITNLDEWEIEIDYLRLQLDHNISQELMKDFHLGQDIIAHTSKEEDNLVIKVEEVN
jgi:hypothetical protein